MESKETLKDSETAVMKYYLIYQQSYTEDGSSYYSARFVGIVEHEEVAKDFCKKNHSYYYEEEKIEK